MIKLRDFQKNIYEVYGLSDDRHFSVPDLVANQNRFTMRALKGIRKNDKRKIEINLIIAFCWMVAIANRLHIDLENKVWKRFPNRCSYCGKSPCQCKIISPRKRKKLNVKSDNRPANISEFQHMFNKIYPAKLRTKIDAGIHLAEETGEVGETISIYLGEHKSTQFTAIKDELADWVSTMFGLANSLEFDVEKELERSFKNGCHACKSIPCKCNFSYIANFDS
ncbi:MAG: hypothetical protein OEV37_00570 [Candidatus Berkelbacteria bacterium]|nr:hypothetical protein [Candidatus Berkelbacteria bacterium]